MMDREFFGATANSDFFSVFIYLVSFEKFFFLSFLCRVASSRVWSKLGIKTDNFFFRYVLATHKKFTYTFSKKTEKKQRRRKATNIIIISAGDKVQSN